MRQRMVSKVMFRVTALNLTEAMATLAGELRVDWKLKGTPVGYRDGLIAATAKERDMILVTRNVQHFDHVAGLKVQNWFDALSSNTLEGKG